MKASVIALAAKLFDRHLQGLPQLRGELYTSLAQTRRSSASSTSDTIDALAARALLNVGRHAIALPWLESTRARWSEQFGTRSSLAQALLPDIAAAGAGS